MGELPEDGGSEGFEGTVTGWAIGDVIQVSASNRMTGCLAIEHGRSCGRLYFARGEIVHAERGEEIGEHAFCDLLDGRAGRFRFVAGTTSATRTIHKNWQQLLLESQWHLDERRKRKRSHAAAEQGLPGRPRRAGGAVARLSEVPGLAYAVAQRIEGVPLEDESQEAAKLALETRYLAVYGRQLGSIFGAGDATSAAVQGGDGHLLFFAGSDYSLGVLVDGATELASAETAIRGVLGGAHREHELQAGPGALGA